MQVGQETTGAVISTTEPQQEIRVQCSLLWGKKMIELGDCVEGSMLDWL